MFIKKLQGQLEKNRGIYYEYDAESTPLGEGGMGVVYKGWRVDESTGLRTNVAIKVLRDGMPAEVYARAEREASIQLRHDNLVEMLGFISELETTKWGEFACHYYVISELLHGIELSDLLAGRFDSIKDGDDRFARELYNSYINDRNTTSIYLIKCILSGVLALHDKGYIHRDIDPSNIMVTRDGCIKLIDFGIAKDLKALGSKDKLTTEAGKFLGKAEYASPELILGDVKNQNYTTDIYALGILFYRLLVGQLPFSGAKYDIIKCQLERKVPIGNIHNKALANIVKKATEKHQHHRYNTIAEFRVAIDSIPPIPQNLRGKICEFCNQHKLQIASCVAVLAVVFGTWAYLDNNQKQDGGQDGPPYVPLEERTVDKYEYAFNLLSSQHRDSVQLGFNEMRLLADNGCDQAKIEVGMTLFPNDSNPIFSQRRELLGLKNTIDSVARMKEIIGYLSSIEDSTIATPDIYYILGGAYFYSSTDKQDRQKALDNFKKASELLKDMDPTHGYEREVLKDHIDSKILPMLLE